MTELKWSTRTVEERGLILPWRRVEPYGPVQRADGRWSDGPSKGTVLEQGEVFVTSAALWEVSERRIDDYLMEVPPPNIGYHQQLAMEEAGLADRETRGGCHGTEKLRRFLEESEE